jgi:hypothetical protein
LKQKLILAFLLTLIVKGSFAQFFEGDIHYISYFLNKESLKPLVEPVSEIVTVKKGKYKIFLPGAKQGQLEWQVYNFIEGFSFSRKSYKEISYPVFDKQPTFDKDGKIQVPKPDSTLVAPILKQQLCGRIDDSIDMFIKLDTTIIINGITCKVLIRKHGDKTIAEYYYCENLKLDPIQFSCNRFDNLDKVYKLTKGSIIVQMVTYDELYTLIYQAQEIVEKKIDDEIFNIPTGIKIVNSK